MTATPTNAVQPRSGRTGEEPLLALENVTASYGDLQALFGITLHVNAGEIVALIGANGAGKTTTLRLISGIKHPGSGSLRFAGEDVSRLPGHEMVARGVSHVPEGRQVFPFLTVRENLSLGAYTPRSRRHMKQSLEEQLALFPRLGERMNQLAGTLSGGEQQMVAIARALMARPKLLCMDEPSMGLSPAFVEQVFDIIQTINRQGTSIFMVEQNAAMALSIATYGYVLQTGEVAVSGSAQSLRDNELVRHAYLGEMKAE